MALISRFSPANGSVLVPEIGDTHLGSVDVLSKKLIYIFQLDNLKHDFFNRNSGKDYR